MPGATEIRDLRCLRYSHLLQCPRCLQPPLENDQSDSELHCRSCGTNFPVIGGIPHLFWGSESGREEEVTGKVHQFYEENPFPGYEEFDDLAALFDKAREGHFARLLDEQIPFGSRVLECGCGTGQLSNFLGIAHRTVFGSDLALNSLALAEGFRLKNQLERVFFLQMNLFRPAFPPQSFDYVICNGVLHHTARPEAGFQRLADLLRPGGFLIVGLYHRYGRVSTDLRRALFRITGNRFQFLDPRIRKAGLGRERQKAWFADQYQNPHESKHTVSGVLNWLKESRCELIKTIPRMRFLEGFSECEELFEPEARGGRSERSLVEFCQMLTGSSEGGFFTVIARRHD